MASTSKSTRKSARKITATDRLRYDQEQVESKSGRQQMDVVEVGGSCTSREGRKRKASESQNQPKVEPTPSARGRGKKGRGRKQQSVGVAEEARDGTSTREVLLPGHGRDVHQDAPVRQEAASGSAVLPPRGRGRGRSRGRGRGARVERLAPTDRDRVRRMQEDRITALKTTVNQMSVDDLRGLMVKVVERLPGVLFDILDTLEPPAEERPQEPNQPDIPDTPAWCRCHNCKSMGNDLENLCCGLTPDHCLSHRADIDLVVLDPLVLHVANQHRADMFAAPVDPTNRGMRHGAYRQFVLWRHGRLGEGVRRVIPSCCVRRIRLIYPDSRGQYTGFIPSRLA